MEAFAAMTTTTADKVLQEIPIHMKRVEVMLQQHFKFRQPSQVATKFNPYVSANAAANPELNQLIQVVLDEISSAIDALQVLERWIQLLVPRIADGNNFGVEVQKSVLLQVSASKTALQKAWDGMTDYFWQRATAYEKFAAKANVEISKTISKVASTGGKDGDETKSSTTESSKETANTSTPMPDLVSYVVAVDVKWYFNLLRTLESVRDHYAYTLDSIEKNSAKVRLPRGGDRGGMSMF